MAGIFVALGIAGVVLLRKPRKPTLRESKHMTSAGFGPRLSRDGKLLAYGSTVGGMHVWVQQTAGGEAIPVTSGPDLDYREICHLMGRTLSSFRQGAAAAFTSRLLFLVRLDFSSKETLAPSASHVSLPPATKSFI